MEQIRKENGVLESNAGVGCASPCETDNTISPFPLTIIPYQPFHATSQLFTIHPRAEEAFNGFGVPGRVAFLHAMSTGHTAHTVVTQCGDIVGFAGAWQYFSGPDGGCCRVFTCIGADIEKYALGYVRCIRLLLRCLVEQWKMHRIETIVRHDNKPALRLAQNCGFRIEGIMRAYDLFRNDYYMMVRR